MSQSEEKRPDIKVVDRRSFTSTGERRGQEESPPEPEAPPSEPNQRREGPGFTMEEPPGAEEPNLGQDAAFVNLCISLFQSGCIHLGIAPEGGEETGGEARVDLSAAQGIIEILSMLKRKTEGNLSADEQKILDSLIAELQVAWVKRKSATNQ